MPYSKEIIKKIYLSLPSEFKDVVATQETSAINDMIAKSYNLNQEQRLEMGDEVTKRLIGITTKDKFASNLIERLKITKEIAEKIVADVNSKILSKIPENLLATQEEYTQAQLKNLTSSKLPEIAPETHPATVPGERAHEVRSTDQRPTTNNLQQITTSLEEKRNTEPSTQPPAVKYPQGKDPYREPIE